MTYGYDLNEMNTNESVFIIFAFAAVAGNL